MVTIGNVDLLFTGGILVRRTEAATRTGGLEVRDIMFSINNNRLLDNVSMTARPALSPRSSADPAPARAPCRG